MWSVDGVFRDSFDGKADETIDLRGGYAIPPFAEAHTHDFTLADPQAVPRYLALGVFYAKNDNSIPKLSEAVRPTVNTPESVDVVWANGGLTSTGGHPIQIYDRVAPQIGWKPGDMNRQAYWIIDSESDLAKEWPAILAGKPDFIKVYLEHSEAGAKTRGLDPALVPSIVARAHAAGLRVAAHVTTAADFRAAVKAGVDEIAHLPLERLTEEDARLAASKRILTVTTTLSHRPTEGIADVDSIHRHNLALLRDAKAPIAFGTDGAKSVVDEIENIRRLAVFDDVTLLRIAVQETPRAIFPARRIGCIDNGCESTFLVLSRNPLTDFSAIRAIAMRVKSGRVLPPPKNQLAESQVNAVGYALLVRKRVAAAVDVFRLNVELYPNSANAYDSLGEALRAGGDIEHAIENYRKSLELYPQNDNARRAIEEMSRAHSR
jgi:hypothetical protein